jgi:uncharacterized protein
MKNKKYANAPRHIPRRPDYTVTDESWIKNHLHDGVFGSIATTHNGQPFITPRIFVYDETNHCICFHGAKVGRLIANIDENPKVCFNTSSFGRFLPHQEAVHFNIEYDSVTVFGTAEAIFDYDTVEFYLEMLMEKYAHHMQAGIDYSPSQPDDIKKTAIVKISIENWSGKQQKKDEEFPGAYIFKPKNRE